MQTCQLCNRDGGRARTGRLGRYALTCDECEARRGSHLERRASGYSAIDQLPSTQWARTSPGWASAVASNDGGRRRTRRTVGLTSR